YGHIRKKVADTEIIDFITFQQENHSIQSMCEVLEVPRSSYYAAQNRTISNRVIENNELTERIIAIHTKSKQRYGAIKIHRLLIEEGFQVSIKRVQRLMKRAGIQSITVKKFRPTPSKKVVYLSLPEICRILLVIMMVKDL
ncbi:MAG TPA: IS3 family transposase, partial [Atopostipes sp.]|nr:IS3 family transposase [Atopostipes sp.]